MLWPNGTTTRPRISSPFGPRSGGAYSTHYGVDLIGYEIVHAAGRGRATFAGWMNGAAGNTVVIDLGGGVTELHMHLAYIAVKRGQHLTTGQRLGVMGATGNATGPCDHYEIRVDGKSVDPIPYTTDRLDRTDPAVGFDFKKDETMEFINVQGKSGSHRAGQFAIYRRNDNGHLVAKRLTFDTLNPDFPTIDNEALAGLQQAMPFIGI